MYVYNVLNTFWFDLMYKLYSPVENPQNKIIVGIFVVNVFWNFY